MSALDVPAEPNLGDLIVLLSDPDEDQVRAIAHAWDLMAPEQRFRLMLSVLGWMRERLDTLAMLQRFAETPDGP